MAVDHDLSAWLGTRDRSHSKINTLSLASRVAGREGNRKDSADIVREYQDAGDLLETCITSGY